MSQDSGNNYIILKRATDSDKNRGCLIAFMHRDIFLIEKFKLNLNIIF